MNVYDSAHNLARALKSSEVYQDYESVKRKLSENASLQESFNDFKKRETELQMSILSGNEPDEKEIETLNTLYGILAKDPLGTEYFEAESRYRQVLDDISKILAEAMKL